MSDAQSSRNNKSNTGMNLEWLVSRRYKIQRLALEIYNFDLEIPDPDRDKLWPVQGLLIGIVFSLWRAVFFSLPTKSITNMHEHGRRLLFTVIETNNIGFPQEYARKEWMAGYYNNNAIMRLFSLSQDPEALAAIETLLGHDAIQLAEKYGHRKQKEFTDMSPAGLWDKACEGLEFIFALLQKAYPEIATRAKALSEARLADLNSVAQS